MFAKWVLLSCLLLFPFSTALHVPSIQNFRPVASHAPFYRSATLDTLSRKDAELLLQQKKLTIIDLRNADEIQKGVAARTAGAEWFYHELTGNNNRALLLHVPILNDTDRFWDEAIRRMDPLQRVRVTLQTIVSGGGALDFAAARNLERGGLPELYSIMLLTSADRFRRALTVCLEQGSRGGTVIFHCQKGKDRTGLLAMLLQHCLQHTKGEIVQAYRRSETLIDESPKRSSNQSTVVDWSFFRGSPASAMEDTLSFLSDNYGGMDGYLDRIEFTEHQRAAVREIAMSSARS